MQTLSTTDQLIREFTEHGEATTLGALADLLDEEGRLPLLAAECREVMDSTLRPAVWFFVLNAGFSYRPDSESQEEGRLRRAIDLARAEDWHQEQEADGEGWVEWDYDDEQPEDEEEGPWWSCMVVATIDGAEEGADLFGIGLRHGPSSDSYARVVVAELAYSLYTKM